MIDDGNPGDTQTSGRVSAWLSAIERASNSDDMARYNDRCRVIRRRFRYEGSALVRTRKYQLLWSNIETMKNAVYAKPPHATVARRYRDQDQTARVAADILERAINFTFDAADFDGSFKQVRDDFLLYGRGTARVYYEPEYETKDDLNEDIIESASIAGDQSVKSSEDDGDQPEEVAFENVRIRFIQRGDFRHQPARTWAEVQWVAFRAFLTRAEVKKRFGEKIGKDIGLDSDPVNTEDQERPGLSSGSRDNAKATVWEIWDKVKNKVLWIAKGWPDVLEEGKPYLELDGFYPCPQPAYGTMTTDSLVPVPDYIFYQDQCEEIDQLTARIGALSDALKLVGFYPAGPQGEGSPEIEKAFQAGFENRMIAVQSWSAFKEGGGGGSPVIFLPVEQVLTILEGCVKLRQQLVEDVYQIIGLSDIMRGASDPRETEGAQQLKAQFGGTRLRNRQQEIARFCRDVGRLCGQIIATYCQPATIAKMTNINLPTRQDIMMQQMQMQMQMQMQQQQPFDQSSGASGQQQPAPLQPPAPSAPTTPTQEDVFELLRDNLTRRFRIDIESDSTITADESKEREDRQGFIVAVTNFMEAWGPMIIQKPELAPLAGQLLLFGVRSFRVGRELEETIEETTEKLILAGQQPPQSDGKMEAEQIKLQATQMKAGAEVQKAQTDAQSKMQAAELDLQQARTMGELKIAELRMKLAQAEQEHQHKTVEAQHAHNAAIDKMHVEKIKQAGKAQDAQVKVNWPTKQPGF